MSESAQVDVEAYLIAQFTATMGSGSSYTTLKARDVVAMAMRDVMQWDAWATAGTLPIIVIEGHQTRYDPGPHGDGIVRNKVEFIYTAICLLQGVEATVERDAKIMLKRTVKALLGIRSNITATDGETIECIPELRAGDVIIHPRVCSNGKYFAYSVVGFTLKGIARE